MKKSILILVSILISITCLGQLSLNYDYLTSGDSISLSKDNSNTNKAVICFDCANACPACGFASVPTVAQVTGGCPSYPYTPTLVTGQSSTRCATFTANNSTVSFNVIINSTCNSGNVSNFSWTLQSSTCGAIIQSGNLSSLTFTGLSLGQSYTFCYTFTVPSAVCGPPGPPTICPCEHTTHYPYFVGATVLPIELEWFEGYNKDNTNHISWLTATEVNNDYFILERSLGGKFWDEISIIKGGGNTNTPSMYEFNDNNYIDGVNYYRLTQVDYNGDRETFDMISINTTKRLRPLDYITVNLVGQLIDNDYNGIRIVIWSDGYAMLLPYRRITPNRYD